MTDRSPTVRVRERGNVLALILLLIIPLAALATSSLTVGSRQAQERDGERLRALALLEAESGLDHGFSRLVEEPTNMDPLVVKNAEETATRYSVEYLELGEDGVDNDGDGAVDDTEEGNMVRITASGAANVVEFDEDGEAVAKQGAASATKQVRAIATKIPGIPNFPYAIYLGDPLAEINMNGNSFFVDGHDYKANMQPGLDTPKPGMATVGAPAFISNQLSAQQQDNVQGQGGYPSVFSTAAVDIQELVDTYKKMADIEFINASQTYTGDLGDPDTEDYRVTYVQGNLKISGGGKGAGLLLVDGNIEITGKWDFKGVMIVTGQVVFKGGGGAKKVMGTVLVGGDVVESGPGDEEDLEVSGTIDVLYSSEIQQKVSASVASYTLSGWQEL